MWPFSKRRASVVESIEFADICRAVAKLRTDLDGLEERHEGLKAMHLKLRGRYYARFGRADDDTEGRGSKPPPEKPRELTREELKRQLTSSGRFVPGRPAVHTD